MSHNEPKKTDHRQAGSASEHADKTGADLLHGTRDQAGGGDLAKGSGVESAKVAADSLMPPGDPREPSRDEWEEIAKNQKLLTPEEEMPSPHLPQ